LWKIKIKMLDGRIGLRLVKIKFYRKAQLLIVGEFYFVFWCMTTFDHSL
jgi:hypothetical protein